MLSGHPQCACRGADARVPHPFFGAGFMILSSHFSNRLHLPVYFAQHKNEKKLRCAYLLSSWVLVPRKTPLPEREAAICKRIKEFRAGRKLSRVAFAQVLGLDSSVLSNVEHGRAPVRYGLANRLCETFDVSQVWLAEGIGRPHGRIPVFPEIAENIDPQARFTYVWDRVLKSNLGLLAQQAARKPNKFRIQFFPIGTPPSEQSFWLLSETIRQMAAELPADLVESYSTEVIAAAERFLSESLRATPSNNAPEGVSVSAQKKAVDNITSYRKYAGVRYSLQNLLARLKLCTSTRGKKKELAELLGVKQPRITEWLSGDVEPGGETTLRLFQWVEDEEKEPKETPAMPKTPPGKTRKRDPNPNEKKPKSSPKQK
jgi:transcriptional regulator with XRE-family HTH domain